jgi:hypothetical protein
VAAFDECEKLQFVNNNFKSNNRIFAQKGVFVFGNQTIDNAKTIKILQEEKKPISLWQRHNAAALVIIQGRLIFLCDNGNFWHH